MTDHTDGTREAFDGSPPSDLSPPSIPDEFSSVGLREYLYRIWENIEGIKREADRIAEFQNSLRVDVGVASETVGAHTHGNLSDQVEELQTQIALLETRLQSAEDAISAEPIPEYSPPEETGSSYFPFSIGYRYRDRNQNAASVRGSWVARTASGPVTGELGTSGGTPWSEVIQLDFHALDSTGRNRSAAFESPDLDGEGQLIGIKRYQPGEPVTTGTEQMQVFRLTGDVTASGTGTQKIHTFPVTQEGVPNAADEEWADGTTIEPPHDADYEIVLCLPRIRYSDSFFLPRVPGLFTVEASTDVAVTLSNLGTGEDWPDVVVQAANAATNGPNLTNDIIIFYRGSQSWTRVWSSALQKWVDFDAFIGGDLLVSGAIQSRHISANAITADKIAAGQISARHINANEVLIENNLQIGDGVITFRNFSDAILNDFTVNAVFPGFQAGGMTRTYPSHSSVVPFIPLGEFAGEIQGTPNSTVIFSRQIGDDRFIITRDNEEEEIVLSMDGLVGMRMEYGRIQTLLTPGNLNGHVVHHSSTVASWECLRQVQGLAIFSLQGFSAYGSGEIAVITGQSPPAHDYFPSSSDPNLVWRRTLTITSSQASDFVEDVPLFELHQTNIVHDASIPSSPSSSYYCPPLYIERRWVAHRRPHGSGFTATVPLSASPVAQQRRFYFLARMNSWTLRMPVDGIRSNEDQVEPDWELDPNIRTVGQPLINISTRRIGDIDALLFTLRERRPFG